ncbi:MAG: putative nitrogen fixation protein NifT [Rhizomicrobium sp.]
MKVTFRHSNGQLSAYVPKKDLEAHVIEQQSDALWGGWVLLNNGWKLELPDMPLDTRLPITVEARKVEG